jgi:hypothetical protein
MYVLYSTGDTPNVDSDLARIVHQASHPYLCHAIWSVEYCHFPEETLRLSPMRTMNRGGTIPTLAGSRTTALGLHSTDK